MTALVLALLLSSCGEGPPSAQATAAADPQQRCAQRAAEGAGEIAGMLARIHASEDFVEAEAIAAEIAVRFETNPCAVLAAAEHDDLTEAYTAGFVALLPAGDAARRCEDRLARLQRRRDLLSDEAATGARATGVAVHVDAWIDEEAEKCRSGPKSTSARR